MNELAHELLNNNKTIRYQNNVRNFIKLIGEIRKSVNLRLNESEFR